MATGELELAAIATHRINGSLSSIIIIGFFSGGDFDTGPKFEKDYFSRFFPYF